MNIDVVGRLKPHNQGDGSQTIQIDGRHRIASRPGGSYFSFQTLHRDDASTYDVFKSSVESLLDLYMSGYNVCLLIMGESGSGKSFNMAGESTNRAGIVPMILDHLFAKLTEDQYLNESGVSRKNARVTMQMYEIYNELVKDLMLPPGGTGSYLDLEENAERGVYVKRGTIQPLNAAADASTAFRQGWARRTESLTDFGPAQNNASTVMWLDLQIQVGENPMPTKSRFTVVELPGLEKLAEDPATLRLKEGPTLGKALLSLDQAVTSLASNPFPDRVINYGDSKLTKMLRDEIGGNTKTRVLTCVKPSSDPEEMSAILKFASHLSQVKNYPILNDSFAQNLMSQYRARILDLQQQHGAGPSHMTNGNISDVRDEIRKLQTDNLHLRDHNERLQTRLDNLQGKFGNMATTKTDLSQQLLMTEEEKLKVSQSLVEMQIENNRIREDTEATKFELTNRILTLENSLVEATGERDKHLRLSKSSRDRLNEMEKDRKDLADEYVVLKTNYLALTREHEQETDKNEELCIELLNLVNAKAALMKQLEQNGGDPTAEVDRVQAMVTKLSSNRIKAEQIYGSDRDREAVEKKLFSNQQKFHSELEKLRYEYKDDQKTYDDKITTMSKELQIARNLTRERQHKVSELTAKIITLRSEKEELQTLNNRLQHKVKDVSEEYRSRLIKYVDDIAAYMDQGDDVDMAQRSRNDPRMREYVNVMLKDLKKSHKQREEQLSSAAQGYKQRVQQVTQKCEELIVVYRNLRQECENRGMDDIDLGPDEHELQLSSSEIESANFKEIARLKRELQKNHGHIDSVKLRMSLQEGKIRGRDNGTENWSDIRKQLREFTLNTQQGLEIERAQLITENEVVKEQLKESQEYIDSHLVRYKQEITRLRKMLGISEEIKNYTPGSVNSHYQSRR